jgi:hypothetical protein
LSLCTSSAIRLAPAAEPSDLVGLVLRRGMTLTVTDIVVGAVFSIAVMRMAAGLLVGVSPGDPVAIAGSALFLCAIALLACYLPARRASRHRPDASPAFGVRADGARSSQGGVRRPVDRLRRLVPQRRRDKLL